MWYIYKKNKIMPFAVPWIVLEIIILNEESQEEKDKYHMISFIYDMNEPAKQKQTQRHREQTCSC